MEVLLQEKILESSVAQPQDLVASNGLPTTQKLALTREPDEQVQQAPDGARYSSGSRVSTLR